MFVFHKIKKRTVKVSKKKRTISLFSRSLPLSHVKLLSSMPHRIDSFLPPSHTSEPPSSLFASPSSLLYWRLKSSSEHYLTLFGVEFLWWETLKIPKHFCRSTSTFNFFEKTEFWFELRGASQMLSCKKKWIWKSHGGAAATLRLPAKPSHFFLSIIIL